MWRILLSASESTAGLFSGEAEVGAYSARTLRTFVARMSGWPPGVRVRLGRQPQCSERDSREAQAEFFQRAAPRD